MKQKKGAATRGTKAKKKPAAAATAAAAKRGTKTTSKRPAIATAADDEPSSHSLSALSSSFKEPAPKKQRLNL